MAAPPLKNAFTLAVVLLCFLLIPANGGATPTVILEAPPPPVEVSRITLELPKHIVGHVPFEVRVKVWDVLDAPADPVAGPPQLHGIGLTSNPAELAAPGVYLFKNVRLATDRFALGDRELSVRAGTIETKTSLYAIGGYWSLVPSLLAIFLALATRQELASLLVGIFLGTCLLSGGAWSGFQDLIILLVDAVANPEHAAVLIFTGLLGGMVGVISASGGTDGIVRALRHLARTPRSGQLTTTALGSAIFFDDYASLLLTGSTMRPITDKLRISREKLSFIVDSTAAPVANIAPISTWVGFEISQIKDSLNGVGYENVQALEIFLRTILYRYYPLLLLMFILASAVMLRDFGPMYWAELRTRRTGKVHRDGANPISSDMPPARNPGAQNWFTAALPIVVMLTSVIAALFLDGRAAIVAKSGELAASQAGVYEYFGEANSFRALIIGSLFGCAVAMFLAWSRGSLTGEETFAAWTDGVKSMTLAFAILILAWALASVIEQMQAAQFLAAISEGYLSVHWVPLIIFITGAVISFATGTAWATMAILMPIAIHMVHGLGGDAGIDPTSPIMLAAIGAVLGGATVGDHISPISDTTIMSAMSSGADLIDHVRTQMPYCIAVAATCITLGYVPLVFGVPVGLTFIGGTVAIIIGLRVFGKSTDTPAIIALIKRDLRSAERAVRVQAVEDLSDMPGPNVGAEVARMLSDADDAIKVQALLALERLKFEGARKEIEACLTSENDHVRATAVKALSKIGGTFTLDQIIARLKDRDPRVRANAVEALGYLIPPITPEAKQALYGATEDVDHRVRATAAMTLWNASRDDNHLTLLVQMLRGGTKEAALSAIHALGELDSDLAVRVLRETVAGADEAFKSAAARALERRHSDGGSTASDR